MELIRTSLLTGVATAIKLAAAFAVNKVVAVVAGPAGMALIGQVQNISSMLQGVSSGLFSTAAVKYTAEWRDQPQRREAFLSLSYTLVFWLTLAMGTGAALLSWWLAGILLNNSGYWWVFVLLGISIPLVGTNSLVLAVINGLGDIRKLTAINIAQSVLGLAISVGLPLAFGMAGALVATILASAVVFCLLLPQFRSNRWMKLRSVDFRKEGEDIARLKGFALMALTSAVCAPLSQLLIREWIVEKCTAMEAGYWQALMRFSSAYLLFFTTTLSVYFLPKFASLHGVELKRALKIGYLQLLPLIAVLFTSIWFARHVIVQLLFTTEFAPIADLLHYQLLGDFMKIGSWVLSFLLLAKAKTFLFAVAEVGFSCIYVGVAIWLVGVDGHGGARGAILAWLVLYAAYWAFLLFMLPRILNEQGRTQAGREGVN